jgi:transposase
MTPSDPLPTDLAAAHAMILAQREMLTMARSEVTVGRLEIQRLKLMLAKARREQFGQSSERGKQLIEQLELAIEDLEETQAEVETKAEMAAPKAAEEKRARTPRPPRKPLPDNLPVERIIEPPPCACGKCGGVRLRKLGEVVSKTLECEPRRWKIIEHVREKFSCRDCEAITEPPAPSHPIPRGFAGPSLLAMVLVSKFLLHQPLNRQSETYAREGIELDVSTLADRVGACVVALDPIIQALWAHVLSAERIHADDTTVPVLAKMKTVDLRPRRSTVRRQGSAGGSLPVLANAGRRASPRTSRQLCRHHAGRCVRGVQCPVRRQTAACADHRGGLLEPRPQVLLQIGTRDQSAHCT